MDPRLMRKAWVLVTCVACARVAPPAPELLSVEPATTLLGVMPSFTLTGTDFSVHAFVSYAKRGETRIDRNFTIALGDALATEVTLVDATTLTGIAPLLVAGTYDVTVTAPDGTVLTLTAGFTVNTSMTNTGSTGPTGPIDACTGVTSKECTLRGWPFKRQITFQRPFNDKEALVPFTVMIALDPTRIDYAKTTGDDLRFLDADETTLLAHEIESWNPGGTSIVWVRVPQIDKGSLDHIFMVYGKANAPSGSTPAATWSDFEGVWHLETMKDSSGHMPLDLLDLGGGPSVTTGQIGGARHFDGMDDSLFLSNPGGIPAHLPLLNAATAVTMSAWVYMEQRPSTGERQIMTVSINSTGSTSLARASLAVDTQGRITNQGRTMDGGGSYPELVSGQSLPTGQWSYVATSQNLATGQTVHFFNNGLQTGTSNPTQAPYPAMSFPATNAFSAALGSGVQQPVSDSWQGALDEVRISRTARSVEWLAADYLSSSDQMCDYAAEQTRNTL